MARPTDSLRRTAFHAAGAVVSRTPVPQGRLGGTGERMLLAQAFFAARGRHRDKALAAARRATSEHGTTVDSWLLLAAVEGTPGRDGAKDLDAAEVALAQAARLAAAAPSPGLAIPGSAPALGRHVDRLVSAMTRAEREASALSALESLARLLGGLDGDRALTREVLALLVQAQNDPEAFARDTAGVEELPPGDPQRGRVGWVCLRQPGAEARAAALLRPPGSQPAHYVPSHFAKEAAWRARKRGDLLVAAELAELAAAARPGDHAAQRLAEIGESERDLLAGGWPVQPVAERTYEPDPRAVLYLLHNSLPINSAGYATRTHGLLTRLTRDGWHMRGATRLGYPYDRWPADDPTQVPPLELIDGVPYHRLHSGRTASKTPLPPYIRAYSDLVVDLAGQHRTAIVHAASSHWNGLAAVESARRLGVASVYEVRGLWEVTRRSREPGYEESDGYRLGAMLEAESCHLADRVIAITGALRTEMVARGVPAEKITIVPNGVDSGRFVPIPRDDELAASLGLTGKKVIGYVGSILDYEGIDLLLHATAALAARRDDVAVLIVGDGAAHASCVALAAELGLQGVVTFTGRVPHTLVERYYSLVDIAPFPRLALPVCEMVSPLKPFEAMAMAKVPIVSSVAALTEIVTDGHNGLVFDKDDAAALAQAIERLLDDPELLARLGARCREWVVAERDWSVLVKRVEQVYEEALAGVGIG